MSVNESKEFEAINQKTSERKVSAQAVCCSTEEINRAKKSKATKKAIVCIVVTLAALAATLLGIIALERISWINSTFRVVLMCAAESVAMFKAGYFWHEIKS